MVISAEELKLNQILVGSWVELNFIGSVVQSV